MAASLGESEKGQKPIITMKTVAKFPRKVTEIENAWITLKDGCHLAARIWLPEDAGQNPVPALLEYLPYRKRDGTVVRDLTTTVTETGQMYVVMPVPASVKAGMKPTHQPVNWALSPKDPPKAVAASFANCRVPPARVTVLAAVAAPKAAATVARMVPAEMVLMPV